MTLPYKKYIVMKEDLDERRIITLLRTNSFFKALIKFLLIRNKHCFVIIERVNDDLIWEQYKERSD